MRKNSAFLGVRERVKQKFLSTLQKVIFYFVKMDRSTVVFDHFNGLDVGCNPGYIAKKLSEKYPDTKIVWLLSKNSTGQNGGWLTYVNNDFWAKCIALASAKVVVFNTLNSMSAWPRKKGQIWIQTGHGSFGIKKIGMDVDQIRKDLIQKEAKKTNLFLSNSAFETKVFMSGFMFKRNQVVEIGHARNDIFFSDDLRSSAKADISRKYGLSGKSVILFAPTHSKGDVAFIEQIDVDGILNELNRKFGGEWVFGLRLHPRTRNKIIKKQIALRNLDGPNVVDLSSHSDMQELLVSVEAMITDYSSGIFDFLLSQKPCFFHLNERMRNELKGSLYFDFYDTPIPVSFNSEGLIKNIRNVDMSGFANAVESFLEHAGSVESGRAAEKAADIIHMAAQGTNVARLHSIYQQEKVAPSQNGNPASTAQTSSLQTGDAVRSADALSLIPQQTLLGGLAGSAGIATS